MQETPGDRDQWQFVAAGDVPINAPVRFRTGDRVVIGTLVDVLDRPGQASLIVRAEDGHHVAPPTARIETTAASATRP